MEGGVYCPFPMRGGDVYFCPLNGRQHLFMPLRNVWLRENEKSNSSGLEIVVAETSFSRNQKMSLLHVLQGPAKRGFTRAEGSTRAKTGSTWVSTCIAFYNRNLAHSWGQSSAVTWFRSWLSLVLVRVLSFGGRGNALAHHACLVRTLSTSLELHSHALSHALSSVVAVTWLVLQGKIFISTKSSCPFSYSHNSI